MRKKLGYGFLSTKFGVSDKVIKSLALDFGDSH